jgi:CRISPR-associated protein Csd2
MNILPLEPSFDDLPLMSARDEGVEDIFPAEFLDHYEVISYRNAARILQTACRPEFEEIIATLARFRIRTQDIVDGGGNKSRIALAMDDLLVPCGWHETRIIGDVRVTKVTRIPDGKRTVEKRETFRIKGAVDGHKIDFVKGRVALDMEWNSKDQTFDRDLYAVRAFYETNIVTAGVLLTRSASLAPVFAEIHDRVSIANFKSKFGASTTWMPKLTYRLDAGRAGGCPILAIGIKPAVIADFEDWKSANPVIRRTALDTTGIVGNADSGEDG